MKEQTKANEIERTTKERDEAKAALERLVKAVKLQMLAGVPEIATMDDLITAMRTVGKKLSALCAAQVKPNTPKCSNCGKPATCFGSYETNNAWNFACDECCGHGNEDGECLTLDALWKELPATYNALAVQVKQPQPNKPRLFEN